MKKKPPARPTRRAQSKKPEGKTLVAVFTEKEKQKKVPPPQKEDRYTSVEFLAAATEALDMEAFEKKADLPPVVPRARKTGTPLKNMMTTKNIVKESEKASEPQPKAPPPDKPEHPPKPETKNERILRILIFQRDRLRGRGMPELDVELDELIEEVRSWGQ